MKAPIVQTGCDLLPEKIPAHLRGLRVGAVVHPASVDARFRHTIDLLGDGGVDLRCLFGPQHGLRGETQDNMIEWRGYLDPKLHIPVHSLYADHRKPTADMLADIDVLLFDLQDVGARYYTFIWTLLLCMEACADAGKRMVIVDRPNPLGGEVLEGSILGPAYRSFVGMAPIPMRHGLTVGEAARFLRDNASLDLELDVLTMRGWQRGMYFRDTGLPWVMPSPNMPTAETALVYPGMCLLEGTTLSEGRGTTRPFEIFGAPGIDAEELVDHLNRLELPGLYYRPLYFEPTFQKHAGQLCGGAQMHVTDHQALRSVDGVLAVLQTLRRLYPGAWTWKSPPYEYEAEKMPIDILSGGPELREFLDADTDLGRLRSLWTAGCDRFREDREIHLFYD